MNKLPIIFLLIILSSVILRFWGLVERFSWGGVEGSFIWDIWYVASGHPTLIGFESAAVGGLSFPPFLLYFLVPFFWLSRGNPIFIAVILAILGVVSTALFYFVGKTIFTEKVGLAASLIYAFSLQAISIDHKFIGGTFMVSVSLLVIFLLWQIYKKEKPSVFDFALLGSTIGLSFSGHYQAIFLFLGAVLFLYFYRRKLFNFKNIFIFIFSTFAWLTPLLVFDLRHNFFHLRGFASLLSGYTHTANASGILVSGQYLLQNFLGIVWQKFYYFSFPNVWVVILSLFTLGVFFYLLITKTSCLRDQKPIFFYFVLLFSLGFLVLGFYRSGDYQFDYYYWHLVPPIIFLWAILIDYLFENKKGPIATFLIAVFLIINLADFAKYKTSEQYAKVVSDVKMILSDAKKRNLDKITVQFHGEEAGAYDYLFYWYSEKFGFDPASITLISQRELYQERSILGSGQAPIKILPKGAAAANLKADYLLSKAGAQRL